MEQRNLYIHTFGCQMNVYDSRKMTEVLQPLGFVETQNPENADLIILNTCSIREKAQHKVISALGRYHKYKGKKPNLKIGVGGCVAQQMGRQLLKKAPYLDLVFGSGDLPLLPDLLTQLEQGKGPQISLDGKDDPLFVESEPLPTVKGQVTGYVTIMKGCDNFCSYCIVPHVRGKERSRPPENVVQEVRALTHKEITLLGQNVNSYGKTDLMGGDFVHLLKQVCAVDGILRVRFTTSHPKNINHSLLELMAMEPKLCNHLHLPLQSGSDRVLKKMNRKYDIAHYLKWIDLFKQHIPTIGLSTDIIVGFPGEDKQDFQQTIEVLERVRFDNVYSFVFSARPHTAAAAMQDGLSEGRKKERLQFLQQRQYQITLENNKALAGETKKVLVESFNQQQYTGRSECNRVVNIDRQKRMDNPVNLQSKIADQVEIIGQEKEIKITKGLPHCLLGEFNANREK